MSLLAWGALGLALAGTAAGLLLQLVPRRETFGQVRAPGAPARCRQPRRPDPRRATACVRTPTGEPHGCALAC